MPEHTTAETRAYQLAAIHDMADALKVLTDHAALFKHRITEKYPIITDGHGTSPVLNFLTASMASDMAHLADAIEHLDLDLQTLARELKIQKEETR